MAKKIIVVGGVAGGATAISRLRRLDEDAQILLLEKGEYVSFANCGLPYYIGNTIKQRDALFVSNIQSIEGKYGVEIRNFSEVIRIDEANKKVIIKDHKKNQEYAESYDTLLLSTGSYPFVPTMEGLENENVFTLWNIPDTDKIYHFIQEYQPKKAIVAGGGFIGIEMAENLAHRGISVTLVEFADQILAPLDKDMAKLVENHVKKQQVDLRLNTGLKAIVNQGKQVLLTDGTTLDTDMILLSIGVRPNTAFLKDTSIALNARGGVIVNEKMQTSNPDIYAVGDMIEVTNKVNDLKTMIPLAGIANKQGRAVAANILGKKEETFDGAIGTSIVKVFDLTVAATGENEKSLKNRNLTLWKDYGIAMIHPMSHAGYYPNALSMTLKLVFSLSDGRILGAQIVGYDGVDKRIDTIATSMHFKATIYDLTKLELAYAPPFSSAKDPVNMVGYYATNIFEGLTNPITYEEWINKKDQYVLVDVREDAETANGIVDNAVCIPLTRLRKEYTKLDKNSEIVVYCAVGLRGYLAERILKQKGYKVRNLIGGFKSYNELKSQEVKTMPIEQDKLVVAKEETKVTSIDLCGLCCPGPIVNVGKKMMELKDGEILHVKSSDPGFARDIESWCLNTGNELLSRKETKGIWEVELLKKSTCNHVTCSTTGKEKTMIVFDGDLDKAMAAFIIANGALAMGNKVNMFFTFWGLNILRKHEKVNVKKDMISNMFGFMMPKGSRKLGLSKMNFAGAGSLMMKQVMKKKGVSSLEELIQEAIANGVKIVACQMSMDVMGITKEELIDGVEIGGVATMLHDSDNSNMNLFI